MKKQSKLLNLVRKMKKLLVQIYLERWLEPGGRGDGHAVAVHDPGGDGKVNSNLFKCAK